MAASWNEVKEQIKDRVDLAAIIARDTKLVKGANGFKACCPLPGHSEKTPSFHINTRDNFFYCFGCQRGGDVFRYLEMTQGKPFVEALRELAEEFNIPLPKSAFKDIDDKAKTQRDQSIDLLERACKFFEENLHKATSDGAKAAMTYLAKRGYTEELARRFRLGWAPEQGSTLARRLSEAKLSAVGESLGLLARGRQRDDFFRARLMIPIEDHRGRVVGFSGRTLGEVTSGNPKYKNSPETNIFKKKEILYGLSRVTKAAREVGFVCIVEGFFDAWAFERQEIPVVAVMGVALTAEHLERLKKICNQVVLVLDTDRAGIESTKRSLPLLYQNDFEVKVFSALQGKDPDEWLETAKLKKDQLEKVLLKAPEGLEWWALQIIKESREKNMNTLQIIHRLEELWPYAKSPAHKRLWIEYIAAELGQASTQLAQHFAKVSTVPGVVPKAAAKFEEAPEVARPGINVERISNLSLSREELASYILNFKGVVDHSGVKEAFDGDPAFAEAYEIAYKNGTFDRNIYRECLKKQGMEQVLARASVDETMIASSRDPQRIVRDLSFQICMSEKNDVIRRLTLTLRSEAEDAKTAQILQQIQKLRREIEELKKFSISL